MKRTTRQNCIDKCTQTAQMIRSIANDMVDHRARYALAEADRHIELCIHSCFDAKTISKSLKSSSGLIPRNFIICRSGRTGAQ